jgi:DNA-binding transcriptional LysR family regulator
MIAVLSGGRLGLLIKRLEHKLDQHGGGGRILTGDQFAVANDVRFPGGRRRHLSAGQRERVGGREQGFAFEYVLRLKIELILNDRPVGLVEGGFDAAFRFGRLADSGMVAYALGGLTRIICAAPSYLLRHGTPTAPGDLHAHRCLLFHYLDEESAWVFDGEPVRVDGQLSINNGSALMTAALNAIGIAMLPDYLAAGDLAAGRLIRLFPDFEFPRAPLQLVHLPDRAMPLKLRSLIDFATERFGGAVIPASSPAHAVS